MLQEMDVENAFLDDILQEEAYIEQPKRFVNLDHHDYVLKLKKALYGLKQALRAWYERLKNYLLKRGYKWGGADKTMFVKKRKQHVLIAQIYVDNIMFGSTWKELTDEFIISMQIEFEIGMVGELTFFLGLQIKHMKEGIFWSQSNYAHNLVKKFGMDNGKTMRTQDNKR